METGEGRLAEGACQQLGEETGAGRERERGQGQGWGRARVGRGTGGKTAYGLGGRGGDQAGPARGLDGRAMAVDEAGTRHGRGGLSLAGGEGNAEKGAWRGGAGSEGEAEKGTGIGSGLWRARQLVCPSPPSELSRWVANANAPLR